jgi:hypothetical protein
MLTAADLMHSDPWLSGNSQFTPKSASRLSHHRESSLSSLGSAGPASPYSQNTSNPHIAVTDSVGDAYHGLPYYDDSSYQLVKSLNTANQESFFANQAGYAPESGTAANYSALLAAHRQRNERGLLPPPELSGGANRSRPVSVASSIASDSPATPLLEQPEDDRRRKNGFNSVPKLDRTMTDIYGDELYNPNFSITSAPPSHAGPTSTSPTHDMFAQRLQAINSQHLSAHSPVSSTPRDKSPFRHGSPLAPAPAQDFGGNMAAAAAATSSSQLRFGSAQQLREQRKAEQDVQALRQQMARNSDTATPQTISPKDAILDFHETEDEANFPLFPQQNVAAAFGVERGGKSSVQSSQPYDNMSLDASSFGYLPPHMTTGLQIPQQYPFVAQPRQQSSSASLSIPSRVNSADTSQSASTTGNSPQRPAGANADGGTYTCTYHGCTLRFETPALLQKHKREGHRQAHGLNGARRVESGMTSSLLNSQAGPHRCDRINPSTGKPCDTVFSRPYDLTRHEDTIHNGRKQKVRCNLCTEDKTFSRADALTRHYRVCHPDVEFPGKHRRRGGHSS